MFFNNGKILDFAYKRHIENLKEIERLNAEIAILRSQPRIAKEAIDKFCPPSMYASAMQWLDRIGL